NRFKGPASYDIFVEFTGVDDVVLIPGDINNVITHFQPVVSNRAIFTSGSCDTLQLQLGP
ncbi:hypothetical protein ACRGLT_003885, partial [Escherichia coli]